MARRLRALAISDTRAAHSSAPQRTGEYFVVAILAASLVLIQVLLGGRGQLFALPAYAVLGCGALLAVFVVRRRYTEADPLCLASAAILFAYVIGRSLLSPFPYFARADLYSALAAVTLYLVVATLLTRSSRR
ncbi:MAG: hypothetical protein M3032_11655, partial [Verrucomicrobiota bacterium]|nr:hypothetical protein [Verrucomicrobiota bacterium]